MNDLRQAPGDNLTWTLSQAEVDLLRLREEVALSAQSNQIEFKELRRRFDNFHSRVTGIATSPVFKEMRKDAVFQLQLGELMNCLEFTTPLMDVPIEELRGNLEFIQLGFDGIRSDVSNIALTGIVLQSKASDAERVSFSRLLQFAAAVSLALIFFLIIMLFFLLRQYRLQRNTADAFNRANNRLQSTFQVSLDAIIVADDQGVILDFNSSAEKVFGFSRDEAVGAQMAELIVPHQHREAHYAGIERFNKTKEPRLVGQGRIEITALRKTGEEFPVEISIGQVRDHRGAIFISYLRDITDRLEAEENLKNARDEALQAERAKSNFLAVMSHEMRTPLNGLFGTMELLQKTKLTKKQLGYVDVAERSGKILLHHVNDVLDVSRIDAGKLELTDDLFDLRQFFQDVITTNEATAFARGNSLVLKIKNVPNCLVQADEHRLRQVAYNLVSNALKFTNKGTVTMNVDVTTKVPGQTNLHFSVKDTGVGISAEDQERVFDRFFTQEKSYDRLASGAGLGLTICKQIIELMDGKISLKSVLGKGTTFDVQLPLQVTDTKSMADVEMQKEINGRALKGHKILLVEDNEINRMIAHEMLKSEGIIVEEAHNGQQAVERASQEVFSAILMDISMPVMNGVDATIAIRKDSNPNKDTPIIALTAHAMAEEQAKFLATGMDDCLNKPVSQNTLVEALLKCVSGTATSTAKDTSDHHTHILDEQIFGNLQAILSNEKMHKLLDGFETEISDFMVDLPSHLTQGNLDSLAKLSHKSVGSSGMIGALSFRDDLRALEQAAKKEDLERTESAAIAVVANWPKTLKALRDVR
jgi:PAS domain S-box-containing protein